MPPVWHDLAHRGPKLVMRERSHSHSWPKAARRCWERIWNPGGVQVSGSLELHSVGLLASGRSEWLRTAPDPPTINGELATSFIAVMSGNAQASCWCSIWMIVMSGERKPEEE